MKNVQIIKCLNETIKKKEIEFFFIRNGRKERVEWQFLNNIIIINFNVNSVIILNGIREREDSFTKCGKIINIRLNNLINMNKRFIVFNKGIVH